jgi:DNA-binding response OmpR family regulator
VANESVLIVDSNPYDLRTAAAQLRTAGFAVQIASTAEQALSMLRTLRPELILVATRLPGMDGMAFAARVKQDPQLHDTILVALAAPDALAEGRTAIENGCHGYLSKPLDGAQWVNKVKDYLLPRPRIAEEVRESAVAVPQDLLAEPEMEDLRRNFLSDGSRNCRTLLHSLETQFDTARAGELASQWAGSAAHLGFPEIASAARELYGLVNSSSVGKTGLRQALYQVQGAFAEPQETAAAPLPAGIVEELAGKRLALVGLAEREAERICVALDRAHALALLYDASEPPDSEAFANCVAVLFHVRPETADSQWLSPDLPGGGHPLLILVGPRDALLALKPAVQTRAKELLIDGWQPEEVVLRLALALSRARATKAKPEAPAPGAPAGIKSTVRKTSSILIADDDRDIRQLVAGILKNHGMTCLMASDGDEALRMIEEHSPNAVVLDVNMPGMDGYQVLGRMRDNGDATPVLMLTARQQEMDVVRGFNLGASDYVVKPFSPLELLARLRRLL